MELCSLTEAFPNVEKSNSLSKEERRAKRKAKKSKQVELEKQDELLPPLEDNLKKLGEIPAFTAYEDAFRDISGSSVEGFKLPCLPGANKLFTDQGLPGYFGKGVDDEDTTDKKEGFANISTNANGTFEYIFGGTGAEKAGSNDSALPDPMLNDMWKPLTSAKTKTAFFQGQTGNPYSIEKIDSDEAYVKEVERKKRPTPFQLRDSDPDSMRNLMAIQLKDLERRMDELSIKQPRDSKNEILIFVGTGLALLLSFDLIIRASRI
jgi:hypothetical protein